MSCYAVGHYHVNALVRWSSRRRLRFYFSPGDSTVDMLDAGANPDAVGQLLQDANRKSVNQRYREFETDPPFVFDAEPLAADLPALVVLKACACICYQSADADDWESSSAYRILQTIQGVRDPVVAELGCLGGLAALGAGSVVRRTVQRRA